MRYSLQVLSSGMVAAGLAVSSLQARADDVPPVQYVPVLDFYVDSLVTARSIAAVCAPANSHRDDNAWEEAAAILVASLWADGFPADFVKSVKARLDRPLVPAKIACNSGRWVQLIKEMLKGTGLRAIEAPVSDAQWKEIKVTIEGDLPAQTKLFDCVGAVRFGLLPTLIHDWNADRSEAEAGCSRLAARRSERGAERSRRRPPLAQTGCGDASLTETELQGGRELVRKACYDELCRHQRRGGQTPARPFDFRYGRPVGMALGTTALECRQDGDVAQALAP